MSKRERVNDHSGEKIGDWEILEKTNITSASGVYKYKMKCCNCGQTKTILYQSLKNNPFHKCNQKHVSIDLTKISWFETSMLYQGQEVKTKKEIVGFRCFNEANIELNCLIPLQEVMGFYSSKDLFYPKLPLDESCLGSVYQVEQSTIKANQVFLGKDLPNWWHEIWDAISWSDIVPLPLVYFYYNENNEIIYIGKSKNFYERHFCHLNVDSYMSEVKKIGVRPYYSMGEMHIAEMYYIQKFSPKYNKDAKEEGENKELFLIELLDHSEEIIAPAKELLMFWK